MKAIFFFQNTKKFSVGSFVLMPAHISNLQKQAILKAAKDTALTNVFN